MLITTAAGGEVEPYTPVRASGTFDTEREVLVYGRSLDGEPGHLVVTPLVFDDGTAALVIRGWVPFDHQTVPVADAAPPAGELSIHGFLSPDEGDGSTVPDESGVVGRLDVEGIGSTLPYEVLALADPADRARLRRSLRSFRYRSRRRSCPRGRTCRTRSSGSASPPSPSSEP